MSWDDRIGKSEQLAQAQCSLAPPSLQQTLSSQLEQAKQEVQRLEELLQLLNQHPEVNRIMELLGGRYR